MAYRLQQVRRLEFMCLSKIVKQLTSFTTAAVHVEHGKISRIAPVTWENGRFYDSETLVMIENTRVLDFKSAVISPGVIDVHMHMNEPGREEWEGEHPRNAHQL